MNIRLTSTREWNEAKEDLANEPGYSYVWKRLWEYENTGSSPEEIVSYQTQKNDLSSIMDSSSGEQADKKSLPLTLGELRQMDGQPVWGKSLITGRPGEWFILRVVEMSKTWFIACAGAEQGFGDKDTYGETWLAYRNPIIEEGGDK